MTCLFLNVCDRLLAKSHKGKAAYFAEAKEDAPFTAVHSFGVCVRVCVCIRVSRKLSNLNTFLFTDVGMQVT